MTRSPRRPLSRRKTWDWPTRSFSFRQKRHLTSARSHTLSTALFSGKADDFVASPISCRLRDVRCHSLAAGAELGGSAASSQSISTSEVGERGFSTASLPGQGPSGAQGLGGCREVNRGDSGVAHQRFMAVQFASPSIGRTPGVLTFQWAKRTAYQRSDAKAEKVGGAWFQRSPT